MLGMMLWRPATAPGAIKWPGDTGYTGSPYVTVRLDSTNDVTGPYPDTEVTRVDIAVDTNAANAYAFFRMWVVGQIVPAQNQYVLFLDINLDATNDFVLLNKHGSDAKSYMIPWNAATNPPQFDPSQEIQYNNGKRWSSATTNGNIEFSVPLADLSNRTQIAIIGAGAVYNDEIDFTGITDNTPTTNSPINGIYLTDITQAGGNSSSDLSLSKWVSTNRPYFGSNFVYWVSITNAGPDVAGLIEVTDRLPAGVTNLGASATRGTYEPSNGVWSIGILSNQASATLAITARVAVVELITNVAYVSAASVVDTNGANNTNSVVIDPVGPVDVALSKTAGAAVGYVGSNILYTVTATNLGPGTALDLQITDLLPAGLTNLGAAATLGTYVASNGLWTVGTLNHYASAILTVTARVTAAAAITNQASVTALTGLDTNAANDSASVAIVTYGISDLAVSKSSNRLTPKVGADVVYTVTVTNKGPYDATGVDVTDLLPTGVTYSNYSATAGVYSNATGVWTIGTLSNQSAAALVITARVDAAVALTNRAYVSRIDQLDTNLADNAAEVLILPSPTLVRLVSFEALTRAGSVVVAWQTAEEIGTAGFYLERLEETGFTRVSNLMVPSQPFATEGARYELPDPRALPGGTYTYRLIEVEFDGTLRYLGPYAVTAGAASLTFDDWSRIHFTAEQRADPSISDPSADPDHDRFTNAREYAAGTDPLDPASLLRITRLDTGSGPLLFWSSVSNRSYTIEAAADFFAAFQPIATGQVARPPENVFTDRVDRASERVIYRVRLEP